MAEDRDIGLDVAEDSYRIRLDEFEGPLDLLLHLIKKNEINIYDIPIALITKQYLDYISTMKSLNLVVAGEFLVMAATLIHIKSRMLLPVEAEGDEEDEAGEDADRGDGRSPDGQGPHELHPGATGTGVRPAV